MFFPMETSAGSLFLSHNCVKKYKPLKQIAYRKLYPFLCNFTLRNWCLFSNDNNMKNRKVNLSKAHYSFNLVENTFYFTLCDNTDTASTKW